MECSVCHKVFRNRRELKNHLAASPHRMLTVLCVWCMVEKVFRRMVDLKEHILEHHRSRLELMPRNFLTENNGFWMAFNPEIYKTVISPSPAESTEAKKARIEVTNAVARWKKPSRSLEEWEEGWKKHTMSIRRPSQPQKRVYSPTRPSIMEDLDLVSLCIGHGVTRAYFTLELGRGLQWYRVGIDDTVLSDRKAMDNLLRRMSLLPTSTVSIPPEATFQEADSKSEIKAIVAKLGVEEKFLGSISKADVDWWQRKAPRLGDLPGRSPLTPLGSPSTSSIILAEEKDDESRTEMDDGDRIDEKNEG